MSMQPASADMSSPSSQLLIEDVHQGAAPGPAAAHTIQRYAAFVAARQAPVAAMHYAPFAKSAWLRHPMQPGQQVQTNVALEKFDAEAVNAHFDELDLSEVLPPVADAQVSSSSSRPVSPPARRASVGLGHAPLDILPPGEEKVAPGGEAWNVDISNSEWVKTSGLSNPGSKRGSIAFAAGSKRGSLVGGASRKASLNAGDSKLWSGEGRSRRSSALRGGFESSTRIVYNMLGTVDSRHTPGRIVADELLGGLRSKGTMGWSGDAKEKSEVPSSASAAGGEPSKVRRPSARNPAPFLRAHQAELKYGLPALAAMSKSKRASMPPLHNRRGHGLLPAHGPSRRGSLSVVHQGGVPRGMMAARTRSQSLPTDSLFMAYSQCALPAVMTSSLASMPVPSQPAIPVSVARRYSVLLPSDGVAPAGSAPAMSPTLLQSEQPVNIDPQSVAGIDTVSVLDTTQLQDLASPVTDEAEAESIAAVCPQPARRGSITSAAAMLMADSASRHSSPASSPVEPADGPATLPHFFPMNNATLNTSALPTTTAGRSRSVINTRTSAGPSQPTIGTGVLAGAGGNEQHPVRISSASGKASDGGVSDDETPDFTPMTSPTNLAHASFRATLMARRMSDVVARDIGKKLQLLQKHMQQHPEDEQTTEA